MSKKTFDFSEALRRMKEGKKVKRHNWETEILFSDPKRNDIMVIYNNIVTTKINFFVCCDIVATDWEEVEE